MSTDYSRDLCVTHVTSHVGENPSFVVFFAYQISFVTLVVVLS